MLIALHLATGLFLARQMDDDSLPGNQRTIFYGAWALIGLPGFILLAVLGALIWGTDDA